MCKKLINNFNSMVKIVVTQDLGLNPENIEKLKQLGDLTIYNEISRTPEEWLSRCRGADIICTGKYGIKTKKAYELQNVFYALPFVGVGFFDKKKLREKNITVSYCPGCNTDAVAEWIIGMIINLFRNLPQMTNNATLSESEILKETLGLTNKKITIIGKGNIGSRVGIICDALDMRVRYYRRENNLIRSIEDADIVVNTLGKNTTTDNILDENFFNSLKRGSFFISVTNPSIFDTNAMIKSLDKNRLSKAAIDAGEVQFGNVKDSYYKKLLKHPKIFATLHIAYNTDITTALCNKMMIENIEAWLNKKPINILV